MQHIKRRLVGPFTTGFLSHQLIQRSGHREFRRLVRAHRDDNRETTAAALRRARAAIRAEVAEWEGLVASDRQWAENIRAMQNQGSIKKYNFTYKLK